VTKRKKIGVLTFHKCINYGSYWQARCLVEALRARGHDAELLDHDCDEVRRAEAKCALQPKLPERTPRHELKAYRTKARRFVDAIAKLPLSHSFPLQDPQAANQYDAIVVGSDEVWNFRHPWYGSKPIFFGEGLRTERLVSYAASFGNHSASDGIHPDWAEKLGRFSAISVRDENSWRLVRGGTDVDPPIVLDPALQFPEPIHEANGQAFGDYAVIYGHLFPEWLIKRVRAWADRAGVRLVSIGYSNHWADEQRIGADPIEFARLMAGSRAVVTNFFHGCVFALLNGKPWAAAPSDYRAIKIPDLASTLGAQHRIVDEQTSERALSELLEMPVQRQVSERLTEYRGRSEAFLDAALS
jgi:hypothetical protein